VVSFAASSGGADLAQVQAEGIGGSARK
jgi:hypothetical protein